MSETDISICSAALMELGATPINSFDTPGSDTAIFLKTRYPQLRSWLIGSYNWECMKVRKEMTRATGSPGGYAYQFVIPADCKGTVAALFPNEADTIGTKDFEQRGRRIVCNFPRAWVEYSAYRPEAEWPPFFVETMIAIVKEAVAFLVTDQQSVRELAYTSAYGTPSENRLGGLVGIAMTQDAQGSGNNPGLIDTAFVDARFGGFFPGDFR